MTGHALLGSLRFCAVEVAATAVQPFWTIAKDIDRIDIPLITRRVD